MQSAYEPSNVDALAVAKKVVAFSPTSPTCVPAAATVDGSPYEMDMEPEANSLREKEESPSMLGILLHESKLLRWRLVPLMGILGCGTFYNLDVPGAIGMGDGETIQSRFISAYIASNSSTPEGAEDVYTNAMNQRLYSVYYYPNIVVPLVSGILVDRVIGPRNAVILFLCIVLLGSAVFAVGVTAVNYAVMVVGRSIIGIASETTMILRSYFVSRFFKRGSNIRGVALAFGLAVGVSRMGSVITFPMTVAIANAFGVPVACYAATLASICTLVCGLVLNHFDGVAEEYGLVPPQAHLIAKAKERETKEQVWTLKRLTRPISYQSLPQTPQGFSRTESGAISPIRGVNSLSESQIDAVPMQKDSRNVTPSKRRRGSSFRDDLPMSPVCAEPRVQEALAVVDIHERHQDTPAAAGDENEDSGFRRLWQTLLDRFHPKRFRRLSVAFWAVCLSSNFFFPAIFPFFAFAKPFFEAKWGVTESAAVLAITCYQSMSVVGCPTFGLLSDRIGRNSVMLFVGSVGALCMHFLLATTTLIPPVVILFCYGTFHGIYVGGFQPIPALIVAPDELGLAFGVIGALNCLGVSVAPMITGYILDLNTQHVVLPSGDVTTSTTVAGYIKAEYVLISFVVVSVVGSTLFFFADLKHLQGVVFAKPAERVEMFRLKDAAQADADGREKEEMEQRIREAADALMAAFHDANGSWEPEHEAQVGDNYHSPPNSPVAVTAKMDREDLRLYDADLPLPV